MKEWFELVKSQPQLLDVLALICLAMMLDLVTGLTAAKMTKQLASKIGINGILRKIASILLLLFFLPVARLIPMQAGHVLLYAFYLCFLVMEIHSVLENYEKMGINIELFKKFLRYFDQD